MVQTAFTEIGTRRQVMVNWPVGALHVGGQGSVCRAEIDSAADYCVKSLPQVTLPASMQRELKALALLRNRVDQQMAQVKAPAILASLNTLRQYLPTHAAEGTPPGGSAPCLLLLRRFCEGSSLQELTAPGASVPPMYTRVEIAKRIVRHLVSLEKLGFVHLDPYPDNVFLDLNTRRLEVALIDLEGLGSLSRDERGRFGPSRDSFEKVPSAYGKKEFWILPSWYPAPTSDVPRPFAGNFLNAARWQILCVAFFAVTWGLKPFCWLERSGQQALALSFSQPGSISDASLRSALDAFSDKGSEIATRSFEGNKTKLDEFRLLFREGLLDPRNLPRGEQIQRLFFGTWES